MIHSVFHPLRVAMLRPLSTCGLIALSWLVVFAPSAWSQAEDDEDVGSPGVLSVERIELTVFAGAQSGGTYLQLPPIYDELRTFDTAADQVLDFQGNPVPPDFRAPEKTIEGGPVMGAAASFFLSPNFGLQLHGSYARGDVVLTGFSANDPDQERIEYDRDTISVLRVGGNMVYNIGTERKMKIWPYVTLGFGGLLNKFPETDDVGALFFQYGAGLSVRVTGNFRLRAGASFTLFSWEQEEVSLNSMVTYPAFTLGLTWRHEVPPEIAPVDDAEAPMPAPAAGR